MILYQALSSYQILECIVHRLTFHAGEKAELMLGNYILERMPQYREAATRGFFDRVLLFRYGGYRGDEEKILKEVREEFLSVCGRRAEEYDKIYAAGIHTWLQVQWARDGISFAMFEDGSGALSRPWILSDIHKKSSPDRQRAVEKYHLYDHTNPVITEKICDIRSQRAGFSDEKAVDFPVLEAFGKLSGKWKDSIREFFRLPAYEGYQDYVLLLTQQFANLGQLTFPEQILIYQTLFDYFLENRKVLIKPHPDDILYYHRLFPEAEILREVFPAELLPMAFDRLPESICTISSTGINLIRQEFSRCLKFNAAYEQNFHFLPVYYMAMAAAKALGFTRIWTAGVDPLPFQNLAGWNRRFADAFQISPSLEELPGEVICFWDGSGGGQDPWEMPDRVRAVLFLNTDGQYGMYRPGQGEKEKFLSMRPLSIQKRRLEAGQCRSEEYWDSEDCHTIYFYSKEARLMSQSSKIRESKTLPYTGSELSFVEMSDEQIRIRMLEGILAATERRLLEYIGTEKELRRQLKELTKDKEPSRS